MLAFYRNRKPLQSKSICIKLQSLLTKHPLENRMVQLHWSTSHLLEQTKSKLSKDNNTITTFAPPAPECPKMAATPNPLLKELISLYDHNG